MGRSTLQVVTGYVIFFMAGIAKLSWYICMSSKRLEYFLVFFSLPRHTWSWVHSQFEYILDVFRCHASFEVEYVYKTNTYNFGSQVINIIDDHYRVYNSASPSLFAQMITSLATGWCAHFARETNLFVLRVDDLGEDRKMMWCADAQIVNSRVVSRFYKAHLWRYLFAHYQLNLAYLAEDWCDVRWSRV